VRFRIFFSLVLTWSLAACVSDPQGPAPAPLSQSSAIATSTPEFITSPTTTLRWYSNLVWIDDPEGRYERRANMLQLALQAEFERKGYTFVDVVEHANYDVLAVAILGELAGQEELEQVFRMYPSLGGSAKGYKRGTVLVALAPAGSKKIVWRGALEMFTDPSLQPIQIREQRMSWGAMQVLSSIPNYP